MRIAVQTHIRQYLTARFGYDAASIGLMLLPETVTIGSQGEPRSTNIGVLLRQLRLVATGMLLGI
jgi:hypothetical protein